MSEECRVQITEIWVCNCCSRFLALFHCTRTRMMPSFHSKGTLPVIQTFLNSSCRAKRDGRGRDEGERGGKRRGKREGGRVGRERGREREGEGGPPTKTCGPPLAPPNSGTLEPPLSLTQYQNLQVLQEWSRQQAMLTPCKDACS